MLFKNFTIKLCVYFIIVFKFLIFSIFSQIFTDIESQVNTLYESFYFNYSKATPDNINYKEKYAKDYEIHFKTPELRAKFYYMNNKHKFKNYIVSFPNDDNTKTQINISENRFDVNNKSINEETQKFYNIIIKINPCKEREPYCCNNLAYCEKDNVNIIAHGDLEIAWTINSYLPVCGGLFNDKNCGIFLELHRPASEDVLYEKKIANEQYLVSGYKTEFISTKMLCSGRFEIWFVFRMRNGSYLVYVKPLFVDFPSCTCEKVKSFGYSCIEYDE